MSSRDLTTRDWFVIWSPLLLFGLALVLKLAGVIGKDLVHVALGLSVLLLLQTFLSRLSRHKKVSSSGKPLTRAIGKKGELLTPHSVNIAGEEWKCRSEEPIPIGSKVVAVDSEGELLIVEHYSWLKNQAGVYDRKKLQWLLKDKTT